MDNCCTVIVIIVWGIYGLTEYQAKKITELSEFYIILKLEPIFTFLISYLFFNELLTLPKIIAFVLTIIANILNLFNSNLKFKIHRGVILSLIVAILLGSGWALDKAVSTHYSPAFYVFLAFFASASNILLLGQY